jgi:FKBP-type peptidyl-prolyl cis-trans isomerase (trigger factor)
MTTYAETYGIEEDEMYTMYGYSSWDELYDYLEESSEEYVKEKLVLYKLADVLDITLTRQDYEDYNDDLREQYTEEELTELQSDDYTTYSILYDKVTTELVYLQISE